MSRETPVARRSICKCSTTEIGTNRRICHGTRCADRRQANGANGIAVHIGSHHDSTSACVRAYISPNARTAQMDTN